MRHAWTRLPVSDSIKVHGRPVSAWVNYGVGQGLVVMYEKPWYSLIVFDGDELVKTKGTTFRILREWKYPSKKGAMIEARRYMRSH